MTVRRVIALLLVSGCTAGAEAQTNRAAGAPGGEPVGPAVVARDGAGHITVRAVRLTGPLQVDGALDEAIYESTPAISDFIQQEPDEGALATERTEAWVMFDAVNVYVSARCWDSHPERMVANEMRRDGAQLRQNDGFAVLLDTYHDRRNAFLFSANPIGGFADSQITDENPPNSDWNTIWQVKTGRFENGWTIEMAIPFKSLRYQPGRQQEWGINLRRVVRWKNEWSHLTPIPRALTTFRGILKVSSAATLMGIEAPAGSRNIEVKPYGISRVTTDRTITQVRSNDGDGDVGLDVKYGLSQNLTADFTANTDFAQVEVDEQQVNLTRFNLFFPEKRDFFLEGQGIFAFAGRQGSGLTAGLGDTPYLFFSRRIGLDGGREVPIRGGGRMTGKVGKITLGVLNVESGHQDDVGAEPTNFSVMRVKRDVLRRSSIGAMVTHRSELLGRNGTNDGYGIDATFSFYQNVRIDSYLAATRTDGRTGATGSYRGLFDYNGDRYGLQAERLVIERNFNPEIGFVRRGNMRRNYGLLRFSPRPRTIKSIRKLTWQTSLNYLTDNSNRLQTRELTGLFKTDFNNSDVASVMLTGNYEHLDQRFEIAPGVRLPIAGYDFHNLQLLYQLGEQRRASGSLVYETGTFYDGDRQSIALNTGRLQITPRISMEPSFAVNWVDLIEGSFTTAVVRGRGTYTMTPRMFVSGIVQYNSTTASVGNNLRFRWEYQPGSELFVVYTDEYDTALVSAAPAIRNRAIVVKINKLLRP